MSIDFASKTIDNTCKTTDNFDISPFLLRLAVVILIDVCIYGLIALRTLN